MREIVKHLLLLEDHLAHPDKSCLDCIQKHLLMVEALADEAACLDLTGIWRPIAGQIAEIARLWVGNVVDNRPRGELAQDVRRLRKHFAPMFCDPRKSPA